MTAYLAFGFPGGPEIWIILLIVLLLFGSAKLPKLARSFGSSLTEFKKGMKDGDASKKLEDGDGGSDSDATGTSQPKSDS